VTLSRRRFVASAAVGAVGLVAAPAILRGARLRVVVVGAGPGGLGVARVLAASGAVDVTLVEAAPRYTTCFGSNAYLAGLRSFEDITHDSPARLDGARVVRGRATVADPAGRRLRLASGAVLAYDRLVLSPGIAFRTDAIEGYDAAAGERMPHAYDGGASHHALRARIEAMPDGGLFVITAPALPFRCPPSPYERASMVAWYFSRAKPRSKILILDAKDQHSKQGLFHEVWARRYGDMVEWVPQMMTDGGLSAVDAATMTLTTGGGERFQADAASVIPPQHAGDIARASGLADASGWCPVRAQDLSSTLVPDVHVLGDAIDPGEVPKSAYAADSQAAVCAEAILALARGGEPPPARFDSVCWSMVADDAAVKVGASYEVREGEVHQTRGFISSLDDAAEVRARNVADAGAWYRSTVRRMFG
jgi:NADPH-dependent 2,4-dienoyl-CoA reductase/sulfur reductase-like enzyme